MKFPQFRSCLIAEHIRSESFGKASILGFYGVTPGVTILVQDLEKPIQLAFYLIGDSGDGEFDVRIVLDHEKGEVFRGDLRAGAREGKNTGLMVNIPTAPLQWEGKYNIRLLSEGVEKYSTSFRVKTGRKEDFTI